MSEMSAEKKKEIEKYIIESYFGHYKNVKPVKPYIGGVDLISGFCDIPDLLVEVEFFSSEMIIVRWNVRSESVSVWKNEFTMRVCRERKIERNRCDSVDAMVYAWESWRSKIQGKPTFLKTNDEDLQKDNRIEELERTVKALRAEKEVMERHIQELEARNVSLAETNNDKKCIEFLMYSMVATHKPHKEDTEITIAGLIPGREILSTPIPFDIPCDVVVVPKKDFEALQTENEQLKEKLHEYDPLPEFHEILKKLYSTNDIENLEWTLNHVCGGRGSVNGWIAVSLFWKQKYEALSKLVGFMTVEEIQDYLTNEANCDTLHEAISNLNDEVTYTSNEWKDMDKKLKEWQKATGRISPEAAKQYIDRLKDRLNKIHGYSVNW